MMRRIALFLALLSCVLPVTLAPADDTEIFDTGWVAPNVVILFDSSGSMNDKIGGVSKLSIAQQVVSDLIANTTNVRFGVMNFRSHGAAMVAPIGTTAATMVTAVNNINTTSVGTPLGDALYDVGQYYKGFYSGHGTPIDAYCRLNMVIVVSDGLQTDSNLDLPDEALLRYTQDHSSAFSGTQNVIVHTVGFAITNNAAAANAILQDAATNGHGQFYSTVDGAQLQASLESAVQSIVAASFAFAAAVVPTTSVTGVNKTFQASLLTDPARPFWRGHLKAFQRDAGGTVPTDAGGVPLSTSLVWDAGQKLSVKSSSSRSIYTAIGGTRQNFSKTNGSITPALLGVGTSSERDNIIDFTRGIDSFDEDGDSNLTEQRDWKLGDILHSSPVVISPPPLISLDPTYQTFQSANSTRTTVLIVGANDGMLHAFQESDGEELWAFVPPDLLGNLKDLTGMSTPHQYYVDSSPVAADVLISGAYKTVVLFGERRGGFSYHALDVTDTTNPLVLWSFTDTRVGETWSVPVIGKVSIGGVDRFVAFFGGGYDTPNNNSSGKSFFAIDVTTGAKLWEYYNDGSTDDRQYMNYSLAASPTAIDLDGDGLVDRVYLGDVGGQMWKFDVSGSATTAWKGMRFFTANPGQANPPAAGDWEPAQAIYGAPAAALDEAGELWIYFGTGDLNHPTNTSQNRFYGLKDDTTMVNGSSRSEASLANVTSTDATAANGWYFLLGSDEKVFYSADVFDGAVYFTTFTPVSVATCSSGSGTARLYAVEADTGYAAIDWSTREKLTPTDSSKTRSEQIGTGIPGEPTVSTTITDGVLDAKVVIGTTDEQLAQSPVPAVALRRILYWREVF